MDKSIELKPSNKNREGIVHEYKIRVDNAYYMCLVFGSKYKAEKFMREEWKAKEIHWIKSFVWTKSLILKMGTRNRTFGRDGFFLRMEYLHQWNGYADKECPDMEKVQDKGVEYIQKLGHIKDKACHIEDGYIRPSYTTNNLNGDMLDDYE